MINLTSKLTTVVLLAAIFISCEKELKMDDQQHVDNDVFVDNSLDSDSPNDKNNTSNSTSANSRLRRILIWQDETSIDLGGADLSCLFSFEPNCWDAIVVRGIMSTEYDIFLSYGEDQIASYFINENWHLLFPDLNENTVSLIQNGELYCIYYYNTSSDIATIVLVDENDHSQVHTAVQLQL
jgi:hypothetical protein